MQADDLRLLGIPHSRRIIAIIDPHHDAFLDSFLLAGGRTVRTRGHQIPVE